MQLPADCLHRLRLLMVAQSPHYVVSTASTRFDDGDPFLTADLARAANERNDDEGTHGLAAGGDDAGEAEAEDVAGDAVGGDANDSQTEGEEEEGTASAAVTDSGAADIWGTVNLFCYLGFGHVPNVLLGIPSGRIPGLGLLDLEFSLVCQTLPWLMRIWY